jgi:hypothetical protein
LGSTTNGREVNRFVECLIGSVMLEIAAMQALTLPPTAIPPSAFDKVDDKS